MIINKDYKLESDHMNITLLEQAKGINKKTGLPATGYKPIGYFATLENALKFLVDHEIRGGGLKDLKTIVAKQQELYGLINHLVLPQPKRTELAVSGIDTEPLPQAPQSKSRASKTKSHRRYNG